MTVYFRLQCKRVIRILTEFGINPYLGITLCVALFIWLSNFLFNRVAYLQYVYAAVALLTVLQLGEAKRNEFLNSIYAKNRYRKLRLLENLVLGLPFICFLIARSFYNLAFVTAVCCLLCSIYNRVGRTNFVIPSPFSKRPFEFTVGFRKYYLIVLVIYIVTVISLAVGNFNLGIFTYIGALLVCMSFYAETEPAFYVWIHAQRPPAFLKNKIRTAVRYSLYISLPIGALLVGFYPSKAFIIIAVGICGLLYVVLGVVGKYTNYPNQISLPQAFAMVIGVIFPPAMLLLVPHFYLKSVKKLNTCLK
ncbi:MAG: hypothetical protein ACXVJD_16590 [Mucilaginibacter sp.]